MNQSPVSQATSTKPYIGNAMKQAQAWFDEGAYQKSLLLCLQVREVYPEHAPVLGLLGLLYIHLGVAQRCAALRSGGSGSGT